MYGISVDSTWCHAAYHEHLKLPEALVLLSDFNREFGQAYGLLQDTSAGLKGVLRRTVFVIDRDSTITYRWDPTEPPTLPRVDDVLAAVRQLSASHR